jgi:hypothetical protein
MQLVSVEEVQEPVNRLLIVIASMLAIGCARPKDDSFVVIKHEADGEHYVIRHGSIEIHATCQYSTYTVKGQTQIHTAYCLQSLPVGEKLKMVRGQGDWLFCTWEVHDTDWNMGLRVEKEEQVKGGSKK